MTICCEGVGLQRCFLFFTIQVLPQFEEFLQNTAWFFEQ